MAKMGRPKVDSPKLKSIGIRLKDEEYEKLIQYASKNNLTITQTVLQGLHILYEENPESTKSLSSK
ncbi:MAG: CopG family transcriptional regulator [Lachnospiraceae bacterium]